MKHGVMAALLLVGLSVPAFAANSFFVVVDSVKNCSVVEGQPSDSLGRLGEKDGYATKDDAKKALAEIRTDEKQCAGVVE
jgi:hypothetical protein